ncbi:deleted in malignant brain tumors 1 protein-like [Mercenaria mercenaria]|uniref:deleted in malignant brain tumors 1 protein-like n=1 Tax=Mercenaria mercenaria TaxID=6596 RepID=UPI00234E8827|nr:deleted in malignant brain tumors 1 protein-like [Mercenaria mercenaria]
MFLYLIVWCMIGAQLHIVLACDTGDIQHVSSVSFDNGTYFIATCNDGFVPEKIYLQCFNGTWQYDEVCTSKYEYPLNITEIRLSRGPYHGRIELKVNDTWGTVCNDSFNANDANVICHMLGFTEGANYIGIASFGEGSGPIYVDELSCSGNESHINECKYNTEDDCSHSEDMSVICNVDVNITEARLENGTGPYDGRAEVKVNSTWGTICGTNFDETQADSFCNLLGLRATQFYTNATYGEGTGPIFDIYCSGSDMSSCLYLITDRCNHSKDVSVVCKGYPINITDIRLADGNRTSRGRVEIHSIGLWGTICDHSFGMPEANVICSMVGYPKAVSYHGQAFYGEGKGPVFVDDLECGLNAAHLNNCTYVTNDNCEHSDDVSVVCTDCGDLRPAHGFVNASDSRLDTTVYIQCEDGYRLIGSPLITCQQSNNWSDHPTCKLIGCGDPTPSHGIKNSNETTNGTVILISCDKGYTLSGNASITCQSDETWSDIPTCEIIDCGKLEVANGTVNLSSATTFGALVSVSCNEGYDLDGSNIVECTASGWNKSVSCILQDCGDPTPENGKLLTTEGTKFGNKVEIDCSVGYELIGERIVTCQNGSKWSNASICRIKDCGWPSPSNASVNLSHNVTTVGAIGVISCFEGYSLSNKGNELSGNSTIICQANGTWSEIPVCDFSDCGKLEVANGTVNSSSETKLGALVSVTCNEGYDLDGPYIVKCTASGWNESVSCILQDCGDPTPENGKLITTEGTKFGNKVEIDCSVGYELIGERIVTCQNGSKWSNASICRIKDCGWPSPSNASVNLSHNVTTVGAIGVISCFEGYSFSNKENEISGNLTITCQANGTWSEIPVCDFPDCGKLEVAHGTVNSSSETKLGALVSVTCNEGYDLDGPYIVKCTASGWNESVSCILQDCGDPTPENGKISTTEGTKFGNKVEIDCNVGYELIGERIVTCQNGSKWSNASICRIKDCEWPSPSNAYVNLSPNVTTVGATAVISCFEGYSLSNKGNEISGNSTITCQPNGTWSEIPVCDFSDCGKLEVAHGTVNSSSETKLGTLVSVTCNEGYDLDGPYIVKCTANSWNESVSCILQDCGDPTPENGKLITTEGTKFGNKVEIDCSVGYELIGERIVTCQSGSKWSNASICRIKDCGWPSPSNANVNLSPNVTTVGAIGVISCFEGYSLSNKGNELSGNSTIICQGNGTWSEIPVCDFSGILLYAFFYFLLSSFCSLKIIYIFCSFYMIFWNDISAKTKILTNLQLEKP